MEMLWKMVEKSPRIAGISFAFFPKGSKRPLTGLLSRSDFSSKASPVKTLAKNGVPKAISARYSTISHTMFPCLNKQRSSLKYKQCYEATKRYMSSSDDDDSRKDSVMKVKRVYLKSPYKWFDIKVKMLLLKSFFDHEFDENEFLQGARQAICLVSSYISEGKFGKLAGLLSDRFLFKATEDSKDLYQETIGRSKLRVADEDIDNISFSNMAFVYDEKGRKWVDILVTCHCVAEDSSSRKIGNVEIIGIPTQRVFNFSFVREYTPGVTADWIVDRIVFNKASSGE